MGALIDIIRNLNTTELFQNILKRSVTKLNFHHRKIIVEVVEGGLKRIKTRSRIIEIIWGEIKIIKRRENKFMK